jgi:DNA-binding HxlR family transcriptional regulator
MVEYHDIDRGLPDELTEKGRALLPVIDKMREFGHAWLVPEHTHH